MKSDLFGLKAFFIIVSVYFTVQYKFAFNRYKTVHRILLQGEILYNYNYRIKMIVRRLVKYRKTCLITCLSSWLFNKMVSHLSMDILNPFLTLQIETNALLRSNYAIYFIRAQRLMRHHPIKEPCLSCSLEMLYIHFSYIVQCDHRVPATRTIYPPIFTGSARTFQNVTGVYIVRWLLGENVKRRGQENKNEPRGKGGIRKLFKNGIYNARTFQNVTGVYIMQNIVVVGVASGGKNEK